VCVNTVGTNVVQSPWRFRVEGAAVFIQMLLILSELVHPLLKLQAQVICFWCFLKSSLNCYFLMVPFLGNKKEISKHHMAALWPWKDWMLYSRLQPLVTLNVRIMVFWHMMLSSLVNRYQYFGGTCCLHLQDNQTTQHHISEESHLNYHFYWLFGYFIILFFI
jgi:hypothetical protein